MKCLAAVALVVALVALPSCAQRGESRGGFSGRGASASRGGFAASASSRFSGSRGFAPGRSPGIVRGFQRGVVSYPGVRQAYPGARTAYPDSRHHRRPYERTFRDGRVGFGYVAPSYGWVSPYLPLFADDQDYDSPAGQNQAPENQASAGYDALPPYPSPPAAPSQPALEMARPAPAPLSEEAVTLIFKDGRPPEQIRNYVLTRTTLFVGDQQRRVIPTDQLDLVATANANREAGVAFQLPEAPR